MESKVNYTIVGIFVVLLTIAIIAAGLWLTRGSQTAVYHTYVTIMDESVSGLSEQAPVKFNGVSVGYVTSIALNYQNPQQVIVKMDIESGVPITTSTAATLLAQGITGITYVGLKARTASAPLLRTEKGHRYPEIPYEPSLLVQLDQALRDLGKNMKTISGSFNRVFDQQNTLAIKNSLHNIDIFTNTLAKNSGNLDQILKNTAESSKHFPDTIKQLQATLASMQQMTQRISTASDYVSQTMQSGNTFLQSMNQQALPSTLSVITKLDSITENLNALSSLLRSNPSIIIRGSVAPAPGPGEK